MDRRRWVVTVIAGLVIPVILMFLTGRGGGSSLPEQLLVGFAGRIQGAARWVTGGASGLVERYVSLVGVREENEHLRAERDRLMQEALLAKQLAVEVQRLRKVLDLREKRPDLRLEAARVVAVDVTPFHRVGRIQVQADGVALRPDLAVLTPEGLVGRTIRAAGSLGDVMLLGDQRSRVACEVLGQGVLGVLIGSGLPDRYAAWLQVAQTEDPLPRGAVVVTSGHDRVFPRGIEVGYLLDQDARRRSGPFVEYEVRLAANPAAWDTVLVAAPVGAGAEP
ncbi:rod shape-determining protein MreC [Myxococcota bacterium]|nr:rod shape-determining protein MreC [Myxococcota bacterium]